MQKQRRWFGALLAAALCLSLLAGCGGGEEGVDLSVCVGAAPESLDPIYAVSAADQTILTHLYENLMQASVDENGALTAVGGMAKSAESETDVDGNVTWTFRLRSAKWSDGKKVTADDFVYAWQRLADPERNSPYASLLSIVAGYEEARASGDMSLLRVSAENDSTLVVVLNGNYEWFLTQVCTSTATMPLRRDLMEQWEPEETGEDQAQPAEETDAETDAETDVETEEAPWWSDVSALVTNGPYQVAGYTRDESLTAVRYEDYYGRLNGPEMLTFRFAATAEEAWALYEAGAVDFVGELPQEQMDLRAADETKPLAAELNTYAVVLNCARDLFDEAEVRRALTLVLDRNALAQAAGADARAAEGLVPPDVPDSDGTAFRTDSAVLDNDPNHYADACAQAAELLSQAGYDGGRGLGDLEYLYVDDGAGAAAVAQALCQMWNGQLDLHVTARAVTEEELARALAEGSFTLAGVKLRAAANDPACFLMPWVSQSGENIANYANSAYDTLLSIIAGAQDSTARSGCLHDAEALLLEDGVVAPLYTTVTGWQLRDALTGLWRDGRGWFRFTGVVARSV